MMRSVVLGILLLAASWGAAAAETCAQAQLGTVEAPRSWSLYAVADGGRFVDCRITIRGRHAIIGACRAENTPWSTVRRDASYITLGSACALTGRLDSPGVLATIGGTFTVTGWPSPRGYGSMKRLRPAASQIFTFTLLRLR